VERKEERKKSKREQNQNKCREALKMEGKGREVEEEPKERGISGEERYEVRGELSGEIEERVRVLEWMGRAESRESYRERQGKEAKRLGVTVRQV
jgi:hypothetical protein